MAKSKMIKAQMDENLINTVALYARVSTDRQSEEGYSIEIQRERLQAYIKARYPSATIREYVDDGYSGGSIERPAMRRLITDVIDKKISLVLVMKLDRLSRSQKDTLYLIEDVFLSHGVWFSSMQENFDTSTSFGRAVVGILSVFAQLERENIFERTRSGMQKRVEQGYWPGGGRVPFGYDYDDKQGILVPNKDADTVRRIYELYLNHHAPQDIANMCGLKYDRLVTQILSRKSNAGYIVYNGNEYKGRHEPIISIETYDKAMLEMAERSVLRSTSTDHLLTGLVFCGKCQAKMRYAKWGKAGYKLMCYSQQKSKPYLIKDPNCDNPKPWADEIEDVVINDLFKMADNIELNDEDSASVPPSPLSILQEQYNGVMNKLKRLYEMYATDDNEALLSVINDTKREAKKLDDRIQLEIERSVITVTANESREKLQDLRGYWEHMTVKERRDIIRSVVERITVTNTNINIEYKI